MIKGSVEPVAGVVAHVAIRWICLSLVVLCIIILDLVTGNAISLGIQ